MLGLWGKRSEDIKLRFRIPRQMGLHYSTFDDLKLHRVVFKLFKLKQSNILYQSGKYGVY